MAVSSAKGKSPASKRSSGKRAQLSNNPQWKRFWIWLTLLMITVLTVGFAVGKWLPPKPMLPPHSAASIPAAQPLYEIYPPESHPLPPVTPRPSIPQTALPKAAILFDDMGADLRAAKKLIELGCPLTFSLLPFSPHRMEVAQLASENGIELMAHIPMEPKEYPHVQPGQGALLNHMNADQLTAQLMNDLESLPNVLGINNHMGSRLTAKGPAMEQVMAIVKTRHLFFIDSRTTPSSAARAAAKLLQVPFAERDVFLDHVLDKGAVRSQIVRFIETAQRNGRALAIGHPHEETIAVLEEQLPELRRSVTLVPVSALVSVVP